MTGPVWPPDAAVIGRRLRELRAWRGLSQRALAGLAGYSSSYVDYLERGDRPLDRLSTIAALAGALRVAPSALLDEYPGGQLAQFLAEAPEVLSVTLKLHRDDGSGRCRACPAAESGQREHPCFVRVAAEQAVRLRARERAS